MDIILLVLHVMLALGIITLVLLQKGKGATEGATFGGGGAGSVFGASGSANFLSKSTAILATVFFINSLALAYLAANREQPESVLDSITQQVEQPSDGAAAIVDTLQNKVDELMPPADDATQGPVDTDVPPPAAE